jgi:hypothetical protein
MLFGERVAVYCENHTERLRSLKEIQIPQDIKAGGSYANRRALGSSLERCPFVGHFNDAFCS